MRFLALAAALMVATTTTIAHAAGHPSQIQPNPLGNEVPAPDPVAKYPPPQYMKKRGPADPCPEGKCPFPTPEEVKTAWEQPQEVVDNYGKPIDDGNTSVSLTGNWNRPSPTAPSPPPESTKPLWEILGDIAGPVAGYGGKDAGTGQKTKRGCGNSCMKAKREEGTAVAPLGADNESTGDDVEIVDAPESTDDEYDDPEMVGEPELTDENPPDGGDNGDTPKLKTRGCRFGCMKSKRFGLFMPKAHAE